MTHPDDFDTIALDEQYTLKVETREDRMTRDGEWVVCYVSKNWWLLDNGTPVAFLKTLFHTGGDNIHGGYPLHLCDIEVRDGHRGQGHARRIVAAAEAIEGLTVWTSGGFTPLGAQGLAWLPVLPGNEAGVKYNDMAFVHDWDTFRGEFPL